MSAIRAVTALLVFALAAAACGTPNVDGETTTSASPTSQPATTAATTVPTTEPDSSLPEEMTISAATEADDLASHQGHSTTAGIAIRNIQEPLIDRRSDATNEFVGVLAHSWEVIDPQTIRFFIREGIKFHDGSDLDAEAVAFAYNWTWSTENGFSGLGFMGPQITAEVVEEFVVDVKTESPDPLLIARIPHAMIFSKAHFDTEGREAWESEPVGTGPYRFVEWQRGQFLTMERFEEWWALDAQHDVDPDFFDRTLGAPDAKRATILFRSDEQARISTLQAGESQLAEGLAPETCIQLFGEQCIESPVNNTIFLRPDAIGGRALADVRVREAVALAVDGATLAEALYGIGQPASQMVVPSAVGHNPDIPPFPYDPERARALLAEAAADGVDVEEPIILSGTTIRPPQTQDFAEAVGAYLEAVGFNVTIELQEISVWLDAVFRQKPPPEGRNLLMFLDHVNRLNDMELTSALYLRCEGSASMYCDPELDAFEETIRILSGEARQAGYAEYATRVVDDFALVPLFHLGPTHAISDEVDWKPRQDQGIYFRDLRWKR